MIENKIMYTKKKVERTIHIPPGWCNQICAHSMNEVCVEICAPRRDACWFELKKDYTLDELPPFSFETWQNEMTPKERQTYIGLYMAKVVDHLQGREQRVWSRSTRPNPDRERNHNANKDTQIKTARNDLEKGISPHPNGEECSGADNMTKQADHLLQNTIQLQKEQGNLSSA